jgi:DNA end-binding protein Ku
MQLHRRERWHWQRSVKVESSETMTVEKFVEADSIDPIYYHASYYVVPDGQTGLDV